MPLTELHINRLTIKRQKHFCGEKVWTYLYKKDIQMNNNHMKKCPISLVISETQIKTRKQHFTYTNVARIKMAGNRY